MNAPALVSAACLAALALAACERDPVEPSPYSGGERPMPAPETPGSDAAAPATAGGAMAGRTIRVVGSSTVYPFSTATAENFGARSGFRTPVVEGTGTGGGMNLFCAGVGQRHPDMTGASRRMLASEYDLCRRNGVDSITEILIGYDGVVMANSVDGPEVRDLTLPSIFLALAAEIPMPVDADGEALFDARGRPLQGRDFTDIVGYACDAFIPNPFGRWSDIDPNLPRERIEVIGPPPTSGTRDAFVELGMHEGARGIDCLAEMEQADAGRFGQTASRVREDGAWIDGGENDNVIVQTIAQTPGQFGIFGYSYLEQNSDRIRGVAINGVMPEYDLISDRTYPISRSMYFYVKNQHVGVVPGMAEFVEEFVSDEAFGPFGYLADRGLVAMPEDERIRVREESAAMTPMPRPE